jgi:hypothetical protein
MNDCEYATGRPFWGSQSNDQPRGLGLMPPGLALNERQAIETLLDSLHEEDRRMAVFDRLATRSPVRLIPSLRIDPRPTYRHSGHT